MENVTNSCDGIDEVDDLTKQMGKLWWPDADPETTNTRIPSDTTIDNDVITDEAKYLSSLPIQASIEKLWARERFEMDAAEREDIASEIHGVQSKRAIQETPEVVSKGIQSLRDYIDQEIEGNNLDIGKYMLRSVTKDAYKQVLASEIKAGGGGVIHVNTKEFLLKFLRAAHFFVEKAGEQFFRRLDFIHELFGDVAFRRPLMMTDLTNREQRYLKRGQVQLLPSRDRVGRRIFAFSGREDRNFTMREKCRTMSYLMDVCSEDQSTQKLGLVCLLSLRVDRGDKPLGEKSLALRLEKDESLGGLSEREYMQNFIGSIPLRVSAIHITAPDTFIYKVQQAILLFFLGREERKVARFHMGSQMECNYSLKSFGISPDEVPVTIEGYIKNKKVARFIAARQSIEIVRRQRYQQQQETEDPDGIGVECPEVNCIIFGNRARYNPANLEFRNILKIMERNREEQIARCESVPSVKEFITGIIQIAKSPEYNLRFVAYDKKTSLFVEIEDFQELYSTVSQSLRDERKRTRLENRMVDATQRPTDQDLQLQENQRYRSDSSVDFGWCGGSIVGFDAAKRRKGPFTGCYDM